MKQPIYLGDGVYAEPWLDGVQLTIRDGEKDTNTIFLEKEVLTNLLKYINEE